MPLYNQIINTNAPMVIDAIITGEQGEYTLNASVTLEENFNNDNVKVVFILAREISADYFSSVIAYENMDFDLTNAGASGSYSQSFSVNSSWDAESIKGYVMVQKWLSGDSEIYQAAEAGTPAVTITEADFGPAYIGSAFTKDFLVDNIGSTETNVDILVDAPGFDLSGETNYSLAAGENQTHTITFLPTEEQEYTGLITITTSIPGFENNTITLSGSGFLNTAPVIENLSMSGMLMKNSSIEITYDFVDADNDSEGNTSYQWYVSDDAEEWTEFTNLNSDQFELYFTAEHIGKYFKFNIQPYDEHFMPGEEVSIQTESAIIDLAPPANLTFSVEGNNVVLSWEPPIFPVVRGLFGYKILRGSSFIATITNTETMTYTDENLEDGDYTYTVRAVYSPGGLSGDSNPVNISVIDGVSNENDIQEVIISNGSYPNPFSNSSVLDIQTKREQHIKVAVYNLKGQLIRNLSDKSFSQGVHSITWDGKDNNGKQCSNGVYFYRVISPEKTMSKKTILLK